MTTAIMAYHPEVVIDVSKASRKQIKLYNQMENQRLARDMVRKGTGIVTDQLLPLATSVIVKALDQNTTRAIIGAGTCSLLSKWDEENKYFWGVLASGIVTVEMGSQVLEGIGGIMGPGGLGGILGGLLK